MTRTVRDHKGCRSGRGSCRSKPWPGPRPSHSPRPRCPKLGVGRCRDCSALGKRLRPKWAFGPWLGTGEHSRPHFGPAVAISSSPLEWRFNGKRSILADAVTGMDRFPLNPHSDGLELIAIHARRRRPAAEDGVQGQAVRLGLGKTRPPRGQARASACVFHADGNRRGPHGGNRTAGTRGRPAFSARAKCVHAVPDVQGGTNRPLRNPARWEPRGAVARLGTAEPSVSCTPTQTPVGHASQPWAPRWAAALSERTSLSKVALSTLSAPSSLERTALAAPSSVNGTSKLMALKPCRRANNRRIPSPISRPDSQWLRFQTGRSYALHACCSNRTRRPNLKRSAHFTETST